LKFPKKMLGCVAVVAESYDIIGMEYQHLTWGWPRSIPMGKFLRCLCKLQVIWIWKTSPSVSIRLLDLKYFTFEQRT
jgi:hypothetical protein